MPGFRNPPLTPLLQISASKALGPLLESAILSPQKEYKVDGVLKIKNTTSTVDPGRRGVYLLAGTEEMPILQESLFFGKNEAITVEYGSQRIVISASEDYGITLEVRLRS